MPLSFANPARRAFPIFLLRNQFMREVRMMSLDLDLIYSDFNFTMDKPNHHNIYEFEQFRLDAAHLMLYRGTEEISLVPKAVETLLALVERRNEILSKDALMEIIWTDSIVEESNLSKYLHVLRKTLGNQQNGKPFIETFRRRGYRFNGEVKISGFPPETKRESTVQNFALHHLPTNGGGVREATTGKIIARADWRHEPKEEKPMDAVLTPAQITELPQAKRNNYTPVVAVVSGLLIWALGFFAFTGFRSETLISDAPITTVAVLPFENASGDEKLDYLSDGLSESVIDRLSQLPQLKVIARNSSFKYRGQNVDLPDAAATLGVRAIVTGRITRRGENLVIRVEIIDMKENRQLWSEQFNRKSADALAVQEEIARTATEKLRLKLSGAEAQKLANRYTENSEAYGLYLRGHFLQYKITPQDLFQSIELYQQAVALDPNFALAFVGLAESTGRLSVFRDIPRQNYKQISREYALKAVSLDDQLPEAHATLGSILLQSDYDFAGAEREYNRALELNPNYAEAYLWRGRLLSILGRHEEAFPEILRAIELDPMSLEANSAYGEALFFARRYDESIVHLKKVINLDANYFPAHRYLAFNYEMKGDYAARIAESVKLNEITGTRERGEAMKKSFDKGGWQGFLRDATDDKQPFDLHGYLVVTFFAELGNKDKAFAILEKLYEGRTGELILIKVDPRLDNLRDDPRFKYLMQRVGLPQ